MLRLTIRSADSRETVLEVHGSIAGEDVGLLAGEVETQCRRERLVLDLAGVRFIDQAGVELLRGLATEQLEIRGGSLFIRALLRG